MTASVQRFRQFFCERLSAAAEEIFAVFEKTVTEYEEELKRQRKLLDFLNPQVRIHRIDVPQLHVGQETFFPPQEPEPAPIKKEPEEICSSSQDTDQFPVKQETDAVGLLCGELDQSRGESLHLNHNETQEDEPQPNTDQLTELTGPCSQSAESQDYRKEDVEDEGSSNNPSLNPEIEVQNTDNTQSNRNISTVSQTSQTDLGDSVSSFKCDTCAKEFPFHSKSTRRQKSKSGQKRHPCDYCSKRFTHKSMLEVHRRVHTGAKPFACNTCGKRFRQTSLLNIHRRVHTGERPYSCDTCGYAFKDRAALRKHIRTHTGEKPYACTMCGKRFCQAMYLRKHEILHSDKNPHHCKTCGKYFKSRIGLEVHVTTHTGKKPYQCDVCGKGYFLSSILKKHKSLHQGK